MTLIWNIRTANFVPSKYLTELVIKLNAKFSYIPEVIVVNSNAGKMWHHELGYYPKSWEVIPNGIDLRDFYPSAEARKTIRAELSIPEDVLLIGLIARFDAVKGHEIFMSAAGRFCLSQPDAHFLLAGEGVSWTNSSLTALIHQAGLTKENTHLLGLRDDIPSLMAALDVSTSCSHAEGFSNTIAESMACNIPCVVTDVGDSAYIVADTGVVIQPRDPDALVNGWQKMAGLGANGRAELGAAACERIRMNFAIEKIVRRYEQLYYSCTGKR